MVSIHFPSSVVEEGSNSDVPTDPRNPSQPLDTSTNLTTAESSLMSRSNSEDRLQAGSRPRMASQPLDTFSLSTAESSLVSRPNSEGRLQTSSHLRIAVSQSPDLRPLRTIVANSAQNGEFRGTNSQNPSLPTVYEPGAPSSSNDMSNIGLSLNNTVTNLNRAHKIRSSQNFNSELSESYSTNIVPLTSSDSRLPAHSIVNSAAPPPDQSSRGLPRSDAEQDQADVKDAERLLESSNAYSDFKAMQLASKSSRVSLENALIGQPYASTYFTPSYAPARPFPFIPRDDTKPLTLNYSNSSSFVTGKLRLGIQPAVEQKPVSQASAQRPYPAAQFSTSTPIVRETSFQTDSRESGSSRLAPGLFPAPSMLGLEPSQQKVYPPYISSYSVQQPYSSGQPLSGEPLTDPAFNQIPAGQANGSKVPQAKLVQSVVPPNVSSVHQSNVATNQNLSSSHINPYTSEHSKTAETFPRGSMMVNEQLGISVPASNNLMKSRNDTTSVSKHYPSSHLLGSNAIPGTANSFNSTAVLSNQFVSRLSIDQRASNLVPTGGGVRPLPEYRPPPNEPNLMAGPPSTFQGRPTVRETILSSVVQTRTITRPNPPPPLPQYKPPPKPAMKTPTSQSLDREEIKVIHFGVV